MLTQRTNGAAPRANTRCLAALRALKGSEEKWVCRLISLSSASAVSSATSLIGDTVDELADLVSDVMNFYDTERLFLLPKVAASRSGHQDGRRVRKDDFYFCRLVSAFVQRALNVVFHHFHSLQYTLWNSNLTDQVWNNLVVHQVQSSLAAKTFWQRTSEMTAYSAATGVMLLRPQVSALDAYNAGYWSQLKPVPAFVSGCTARTVLLFAEYEYTMTQDEMRTQDFSGLMAKVGLCDDTTTELEMSGIFAGGGTGVDNASVVATCDIPYVHAVLARESMSKHCNCDNDRANCMFFRRPDLPTVKTMRLGVWLEGQIDPTTEIMRPISFSIQRYPRQLNNFSNIVTLNETQLNAQQYKLSMPASRWLNKNGTAPGPFVFFHSQVANVTVYKFAVSITDTCDRSPPATTTDTVISTTATTVTTALTAPSTTPETPPSSTITSSVGTTSGSNVPAGPRTDSSSSIDISSTGSTLLGSLSIGIEAPAPAVVIPSALDDFGTANVLIIAVSAILYICCISGICVFRERIAATRCFALVYACVPGGHHIFCCCRPAQDTSDRYDTNKGDAVAFGSLHDVPEPTNYGVLPADLPRSSSSPATTKAVPVDGYVAIPKSRAEPLEMANSTATHRDGSSLPAVQSDGMRKSARNQYDGIVQVARASAYDELRHTEI
jgi:hypothetical protein